MVSVGESLDSGSTSENINVTGSQDSGNRTSLEEKSSQNWNQKNWYIFLSLLLFPPLGISLTYRKSWSNSLLRGFVLFFAWILGLTTSLCWLSLFSVIPWTLAVLAAAFWLTPFPNWLKGSATVLGSLVTFFTAPWLLAIAALAIWKTSLPRWSKIVGTVTLGLLTFFSYVGIPTATESSYSATSSNYGSPPVSSPSITHYSFTSPRSGNCDYSWQLDSAGRRCGGRAASERPGGR